MRKIVHIDMDCFFAAIEERDHPELRGRPLAVGGAPERRGVLATCNYPARRYGLHSAMPSRTALARCPQLILRPVDLPRYRAVSQAIFRIFADYTDRIEPVSLDEAYLDLSHEPRAVRVARAIRERIRAEQGLTASAGVAPNKFLAKVASDWNKPDGLCVILPEQVDEFVRALPVGRIPGVGPVTEARLLAMGIKTCGDLRRLSREELQQRFGRAGSRLHELARGIDERPVRVSRRRKSLSVEHTFASDLGSLDDCLALLPQLTEALLERLDRQPPALRRAIRAQFVKIRFNDFHQTTVQCPTTEPDRARFRALCSRGWQRGRRPVRLLGLGLHFAEAPPGARQLEIPLEADA
ncbi:MAG: DNA polymerase IV [Gammaproteobacteria bacterium]|nr:MAG: DNA polymerase IV [Gammaproteobacteria bacterium]